MILHAISDTCLAMVVYMMLKELFFAVEVFERDAEQTDPLFITFAVQFPVLR